MAPTAAHARVRAARCFDEGGLWCMCMCVCVWVVFKTAPRRKERGREGGEGLPCAQPGPLGCQSGAWRRIFYYARLCISRRSPAPGRREGIRCLAWNTAYGRSVLSGRRSGRTIAPQPKAPPSFWLVYVDCVSPKGVMMVDVELRGADGGPPRHSSSNTQAASHFAHRGLVLFAGSPVDFALSLGRVSDFLCLPAEAHRGIVPCAKARHASTTRP